MIVRWNSMTHNIVLANRNGTWLRGPV